MEKASRGSYNMVGSAKNMNNASGGARSRKSLVQSRVLSGSVRSSTKLSGAQRLDQFI